MEKIQELAQILRESDNIVFFGGAGVSTASNIPDFRSSDGLYSKKLNAHFTPEQAVSHSFYVRHTEEFYDFYKKNLIYEDALPNDCHKALAKLEEMGKLKAVVTQNIDGLHQAAGSKVVYELHGKTDLRHWRPGIPGQPSHRSSESPRLQKCLHRGPRQIRPDQGSRDRKNV